MRERAWKTVGTLFVVALLAAPAAWAQDWRGGNDRARDPRAPRAGKAQPSVNVGSSTSIEVATQPTDAKARRARRNQAVARQTGYGDLERKETEVAIAEGSNSMLTDNQIRKTDYNAVASQLTDTEGLISSQVANMAEDQAFGCSSATYLSDGFFPGLVGDVSVAPPDGLPLFEVDGAGESAQSSDDG